MSGPDALHEWDAAYVLGALSPDDRRLFEEHLEQCAECRTAVTELAGMPALLARVPVADVIALEAESDDALAAAAAGGPARHGSTEPPADLLRSLSRRAQRRRRTRRWAVAGAGVLLAAAVAAAIVVPLKLNAAPPESAALTLEQTTPSPLSATVSVTAKRWGTDLSMVCEYASSPGAYSTTGHYSLYVTNAAGTATRVASWTAWPGAKISASGAIDVPKDQLRTVEIRDSGTDQVLLSSPIG